MIALVALFVALGGTAMAAKVIITSPSQLGKGVVTNAKVKKATLQANRLSTKARESLQGQQGPPGEQGPPGASAPPPGAVTAVAAAPASPSHNCEASPAIGQFCARVDLGGAYNFWRNLGAGMQPAGFFKDASGLVHIQGSVTFDSLGGGGASTAQPPGTIFVLPTGYRPGATRIFGVFDDRSSTDFSFVKVLTDGRVVLRGVEPALSDHLQLDGIYFRP